MARHRTPAARLVERKHDFRDRGLPVAVGNRPLRGGLLLGVLLALVSLPGPPVAATEHPVINEFVANHAGTDTNEFVEILGSPNTDLSSLTILQVEGDGTGAGTIDSVHPVGTTNATGFWVSGFLSNVVENGTITLLLVSGFTGSVGLDLDTDNDGLLDATPWSSLVDDIGVTDGGTGDRTYASTTLAPGFDGGAFAPGGASRIPSGTDTDAVGDWVRNDFDGAGLPGFTGTPESGEALNTPGSANELVGPPPPPVVSICQIQGSGQFSSFDGQAVETSGIVTLFTANNASFWMQDPGCDTDPATSDGIFVSGGGFPGSGPRPSVGDRIRVIAFVQEQQFGTALPLTRLRSVQLIEVLSSGNALPAPVPLNDLPNGSVPDGIDFWEPLEGMLVSVANGFVVGATNAFGELTVLTEADAVEGSGYFPQTKQILLRNLGGGSVDYNPERILVDDSSLSSPIVVRPGERVRDLVGVVDYTFGNYKLQPASFGVERRRLPNMPASTRSGQPGDTVITTFNVENLFDLVDEPGRPDNLPTPEQLELQLAKLALAIQVELRLPDILVVQEVENTTILEELGSRVNAAGGTAYQAVSFDTSDARGIEVGFLWDANRVSLVNAFQLSGPDVEAAFGPGSASPGREPLVGEFSIGGRMVTIVGNHFKSKSGDDPIFGVNQPLTRITEVQRKLQARVVRDFVNTILDVDPDALVVVAGDLNDFQFAEPGEGADHPVGILEGTTGEVPLTNLVHREKAAEAFTFVFDGNSQVLDHVLVSPGLVNRVVGVDVLHFNAGFPDALGDVPGTSLRAADHDPLEVRFRLTSGMP